MMKSYTQRIAFAVLLVAFVFIPYSVFAQEVDVETHHVAGNVYRITGPGGTVGVLATDDGIIMVDSQFESVADEILAEIRNISDAPIRFLINTHIHPDHIGGNGYIQKHTRAVIMAKESLRKKMIKKGDDGVPVLTFNDTVKLHVGNSPTLVIPLPPAHTATDCMIYFTGADVLFIGDIFRTTGFHSISSGGSWKGSLKALSKAIRLIGLNTKVVPGHGEVSTRKDLIKFRDMVSTVGARIQAMINQGKSLQEVLMAEPTKDYRDSFPSPEGFGSPEGMVKAIYNHLTRNDN